MFFSIKEKYHGFATILTLKCDCKTDKISYHKTPPIHSYLVCNFKMGNKCNKEKFFREAGFDHDDPQRFTTGRWLKGIFHKQYMTWIIFLK